MATKNTSSTSFNRSQNRPSNGSSDLSSDLTIYQNYLKSSGLFKGIPEEKYNNIFACLQARIAEYKPCCDSAFKKWLCLWRGTRVRKFTFQSILFKSLCRHKGFAARL